MLKQNVKALLLAASILVPVTAGAQSPLLPTAEGAGATVTVAVPLANADRTDVHESAAALRSKSTLIPFQQPSESFQLTGESDVQEFSFHLDDVQADIGGNIVLAYQNAVSVLPDDGSISVEINGKPAGDYPIASPFDFTQQKIAVSPKLLKTGANTVRVSVSQHHRVDCSLDATYELWTRLSPELSGFEAARAPSFTRLEDLYSTGRMQDGATELRLVLPKAADADMLNAASPIVQALSLYLGREDIVVSVADKPGEGPGIDLFAGVIGVDPANAGGMQLYADAPYGVSVRPSTDPQRAAVIFRGASTEQLQQLLLEAVRGPMASGIKAGRQTKRFGVVPAAAEQQFTLRDAGMRSATFGGRLMRTHFKVVMPADFYAAEYATFDMTLSAATAPGLDPGAQMLVRVNDKVVNSFPFRDTDGQNFNGKLIELPLRAFRPGVNKIEMLAELPNAADRTCSPQTRNDARPRYVLLDNTTFTVPPLARVTRLPDLAAFAGNGYPYGAGKPFNIYLRNADNHSASAALSALARLAMTSGVPVKGSFRLGSSGLNTEGDALVISVVPGEARALTRPSGRQMTDRIAIDDAAAVDRISTAAILPDIHAQASDGSDQLIQAFENQNADNGVELSWKARLKSLLTSASGQFGNWLNYEETPPVQISAAATLLTIVQTARAGDQGIVTEISAGSPEGLTKGMRRLAEPTIWNALDGSAALIDAKTLELVNMSGQRQIFIDVTDQSVGNYRRIAAAWLSDNFQTYVVLVILLVGLFAAWMGTVVQRKGVRTAK